MRARQAASSPCSAEAPRRRCCIAGPAAAPAAARRLRMCAPRRAGAGAGWRRRRLARRFGHVLGGDDLLGVLRRLPALGFLAGDLGERRRRRLRLRRGGNGPRQSPLGAPATEPDDRSNASRLRLSWSTKYLLIVSDTGVRGQSRLRPELASTELPAPTRAIGATAPAAAKRRSGRRRTASHSSRLRQRKESGGRHRRSVRPGPRPIAGSHLPRTPCAQTRIRPLLSTAGSPSPSHSSSATQTTR